jgi:large conductance mechanosensitive channel
MKKYLDEFKDFIQNGNIVALAIAFIMALFFAPVVTAVVNGVILNLIAAIFGKPNFDSIVISIGKADLLVGTVITAAVQFLLVALACFVIVKAYEAWTGPEPVEDAGPTEVELLTEIRDSLRAR